MLSAIIYANDGANFSKVDAPSLNPTEDVLELVKALRNERSEDIQGKIIDNLRDKKTTRKTKDISICSCELVR